MRKVSDEYSLKKSSWIWISRLWKARSEIFVFREGKRKEVGHGGLLLERTMEERKEQAIVAAH